MPATANYRLPTRAEMNAGIDLSAEVLSMTGWALTAAAVETPDMGSRFVSMVPGALTSSTNDIVFYLSQNHNDVRTLLTLSLTGFVIPLWEGDVPGQAMDVFPVTVMSLATDPSVTDPAQITVSFAASRIPAIGITIPS
jgi:hypothetical protein